MTIPPDAMAYEGISNGDRAVWAEAALIVFGQHTGTVRRKMGDNEDPFLVLADLLTDIAHWCDRNKIELQAALQYAARHYQTETGSEGQQLS